MQDSVFVVGRVSVFVSRLTVFDLPACGRRHHVFDLALSRSKLSGSGLVREKVITSDAYLSTEIQYSRTNGTPPGPLPQNPVPSVVYRLFDKRRLAGDAASAVSQADHVIVHRRQVASHKTVFFRLFPASGRHLRCRHRESTKSQGFPLGLVAVAVIRESDGGSEISAQGQDVTARLAVHVGAVGSHGSGIVFAVEQVLGVERNTPVFVKLPGGTRIPDRAT